MSGWMVSFETAPAVGTILTADDQRFRLEAAEPYTRRDGTASALLTWSSSCPTCGAEFEVRSGLRTKSLTRRCEEHRTAGPIGKRSKRIKITVVEPPEGGGE